MAGHYIFALWFLLSSFFFFSSPNLSGRKVNVNHIYFYTWCGLAANLGCRSEMCCTRLAGNTRRKNDAKMTQKSPYRHHRTTLPGCIFATKACIDNRKKIHLLSSTISSTSPRNMVNFGPPTVEIGPEFGVPVRAPGL